MKYEFKIIATIKTSGNGKLRQRVKLNFQIGPKTLDSAFIKPIEPKDSSAKLDWTDYEIDTATGCMDIKYNITWKEPDATITSSKIVHEPETLLDNLKPCQEYEVKISPILLSANGPVGKSTSKVW